MSCLPTWSIGFCLAAGIVVAGQPRPAPPERQVGKVAGYYSALARVHADFGKLDEAARCLRKAVELEDDAAKKNDARMQLASVLLKTDKPTEAVELLEAVVLSTDKSRALHVCRTAAKLCEDAGKPELAEGIFKKALSTLGDPRSKEAVRLSYLRFLQEADRVDEFAAAQLQRLKEKPDDAEALAWMGDYHLMIEDDLDSGLAVYEKLAKVRPNDPDVFEQLAVLYLATKKHDEAIEMYQRVAQLDKNQTIYAFEQIACIESALGHFAKAIEWNNKMLAAGGETPERLYRQAKLYRQAQQPDQAIRCLEKAAISQPKGSRLWENMQLELIEAYQAAGRTADAVQAARRLLAATKSDRTRQRLETKLETLLKPQDAAPDKPRND